MGPKSASKPPRHAGAPFFFRSLIPRRLPDTPGTFPRGLGTLQMAPRTPLRARFCSRFGTPSWPMLGLRSGLFVLGRNFNPTLFPQPGTKWPPSGRSPQDPPNGPQDPPGLDFGADLGLQDKCAQSVALSSFFSFPRFRVGSRARGAKRVWIWLPTLELVSPRHPPTGPASAADPRANADFF